MLISFTIKNIIYKKQIKKVRFRSSKLQLSEKYRLSKRFNCKNPLKAQVKVKNVTTDDSVFVVECFPQDCNLGSDRPARFGFMGMFAEPMEVEVQN